MRACVSPWFPDPGNTNGRQGSFAGLRRLGRDVLRIAGIAMVLVRVMRVPALRGAEVELESLAVAGRDDAFQVLRAVVDRLLADAAFLPHAGGLSSLAQQVVQSCGIGPGVAPL